METIYLDNAATSFPKPPAVCAAIDGVLRTAAANPGRGGHRMAVEAARVVAQARQWLATLINAPEPRQVVFTLNGTEALNLALRGLLRPGDHVITSRMEHNSVARPLRRLERDGVEVTRVAADGQGRVDPADIAAAFRPNTRLVALTHASNVCGTVLPITEVGRHCCERNVRFLVDAAQTAGIFPIDVQEQEIDLLAMPGHKGLLGPTGTGALYLAPGLVLEPLRYGGTGSQSESEEQPDLLPDRYESGTVNTVGIAGLGAGVQFILETGVETICAREQGLVARLLQGLAAIEGVRLYGPPPGEHRAAVVSFNIGQWDPNDAAAVLDESFGIACRPGLHCAPLAHETLGTLPNGTIRFSPGYFTPDEEIDTALAAVRRLAEG